MLRYSLFGGIGLPLMILVY